MVDSRYVLRSLIGFILLAALALPAFADNEKEKYDNLLVGMLESYQKVLSKELDKDVRNVAANSWFVASHAINNKMLRFTVEPVNPDLFNSARFIPPSEDNTGYIVISRLLIDTWEQNPSLAYTLLTPAVVNGASFFLDPEDWMRMQNSSIDKFFMRLGLYTAQAELIQDRLVPEGFLITPYESFLLDSYQKDKLLSAMFFLEGQSLPVAQGIITAGAEFEESGNAEVLRKKINKIGENLLEARKNIKDEKDSKAIFPAGIAIHSWLEFTPEVISRIYNKNNKDNPLDFGEVLSRETDYAQLRKLLEASRIRDTPKLEHVLKETRKGFTVKNRN